MAGRYERRFPLWAPWAAGLLGGALVVGAQLLPIRANIENDLAVRSVQALDAAGYPGADVTFTGRDGVVVVDVKLGDVPEVEQIVSGLEGVRTVIAKRQVAVQGR